MCILAKDNAQIKIRYKTKNYYEKLLKKVDNVGAKLKRDIER